MEAYASTKHGRYEDMTIVRFYCIDLRGQGIRESSCSRCMHCFLLQAILFLSLLSSAYSLSRRTFHRLTFVALSSENGWEISRSTLGPGPRARCRLASRRVIVDVG